MDPSSGYEVGQLDQMHETLPSIGYSIVPMEGKEMGG